MQALIRKPILQAGPEEAGSHVTSIRLREGGVRALGQRLASIGDHLQQDWTSKHMNRPPALLHLLRPAQALTRAMLRDLNSQVWELMSMSATVKAWFMSTMIEHRGFQPRNWILFIPATRPGWTTGAVATGTLVALCCILWIEGKA